MTGPVTPSADTGVSEVMMARNAELVRQWEILRSIDGARNGITIPKLAADRGVHQRTIRRDIDALCRAGFPLYDERIHGTVMWKLGARPFRGLEDTGLGMMELCALYFSRAMLASLAGAPFQDDVERAFARIERALPAPCRRFLDELPVMLKAKIAGRKRQDERKVRELVNRAVQASLDRRRVAMRYHSRSSRRSKDYVAEPLRVSYADGGVYLTAYIAEYGETRTFAVERISALAVLDEQFDRRPLPAEPFANSIGAFSGPAERVEIELAATAADYVMSRDWHRTQTFERRPDGSILMRMDVSIDGPLRRWILGFGGAARVLAPARLAQDIFETVEEARERYMPRLAFPMLRVGSEADRTLPLTPASRAS
jgi:predicted DNA-binding transcriptional regulator YafY